MLPLLIALLMPPCPTGVTAQPPPEEADVRVEKPRVGRPPVAACVDADGHLAIPRLYFAYGTGRLRSQSAPHLDALADWLHAHPSEALRIHSLFWVGWVRGAQPYRDRGRRVRRALIDRGVQPERLTLTGGDLLIPDDAPDARARRRALARRGFWFERRPFTPIPMTDCVATCALTGRCALKAGHCVATPAGCKAARICADRGACSQVGEACAPATPADCTSGRQCDRRGACSLVDGRCRVATRADCARLDRCTADHACAPLGGRCVHGSTAECAASERCRLHGDCALVDGTCHPATAAQCRRSQDCARDGRCSLVDGRCVARTRADCRRAKICKTRGACTPRDGTCRPRSDADCRASAQCRSHGLCSLVAYNCGARSAADCAGSRACTRHGRCRPGAKGECRK